MVTKHRGIVVSNKGIVSSAHPMISQTGINILKKGGNAIDAAIAMALTGSVVHPDMAGLGGDAFCIYYENKTKNISVIEGAGYAPELASIEYFRSKGLDAIPNIGILSSNIPGAVAAYFLALEKFGTLEFSDLIDDAYNLSYYGYPVGEKLRRHMFTELDKIKKYDNLSKKYLIDDKPYELGDTIVNKTYARTLKNVATYGRDYFYKGELAKKIVEYNNKRGGIFSLSDFENYEASIVSPLSIEYRDYIIYQTPPVSQGIIHLEEMNILRNFNMGYLKPNSAEAIHLMVEAKRISFRDRLQYFGDPKFNQNPIEKVLSREYGKKQAENISATETLHTSTTGLFHSDGHTTSFVVVDKDGNAASFIHSIGATFGSFEEVENTGIILNNRLGGGFNLKAGHPNCVEPFKMPMHTLNTYLVTDKNGSLKYVGNTPGGDNQVQVNMQTLVNLIDFGLDVQQAVETPKWIHRETENTKELSVEDTIGIETVERLQRYGHKVRLLKPMQASGASVVIEVLENGSKLAGCDPRSEGCALAEF